MAKVEEIMLGRTRVIFHDDAYADKTPEELEVVRQELNRTASRIARDNEIKRLQKLDQEKNDERGELNAEV